MSSSNPPARVSNWEPMKVLSRLPRLQYLLQMVLDQFDPEPFSIPVIWRSEKVQERCSCNRTKLVLGRRFLVHNRQERRGLCAGTTGYGRQLRANPKAASHGHPVRRRTSYSSTPAPELLPDPCETVHPSPTTMRRAGSGTATRHRLTSSRVSPGEIAHVESHNAPSRQVENKPTLVSLRASEASVCRRPTKLDDALPHSMGPRPRLATTTTVRERSTTSLACSHSETGKERAR